MSHILTTSGGRFNPKFDGQRKGDQAATSYYKQPHGRDKTAQGQESIRFDNSMMNFTKCLLLY